MGHKVVGWDNKATYKLSKSISTTNIFDFRCSIVEGCSFWRSHRESLFNIKGMDGSGESLVLSGSERFYACLKKAVILLQQETGNLKM